MKRVSKLKSDSKLEFYRVALLNAKSDEEFSSYLSSVGYSGESLEEGNRLYEIARLAFKEADLKRSRLFEMRKEYYEKLSLLEKNFLVPRKKAMVIFKNDPIAREKLSLNKPTEKGYVKLIEQIRKFYSALSVESDLTDQMAKRNFSSEEAAAGLVAIAEVEKARADYIYAKGISQNATFVKSKTLRKLSEWMNEFLSMSRIAFGEQPQLMESLGMVVKD